MTWQPQWWLVVLAGAVAAALAVAASRRWSTASTTSRALDVVRVVAALGLVVVALRPSGEQERDVPVVAATDVVIMLDRTASMGALDHLGGSRMDGASADLIQGVAAAAGAHVTVIAFDDSARVLVPATTDVGSVVTTLGTVGWRPSAKATGSDVSVGVELARETLAKVASQRPRNTRVLVYAGDGEQTQSTPRTSFAPLAELVDEAWVLGYGTQAGGEMPVAPGSSERVKLRGSVQRSVLDEQALRAIAGEVEGTYVHRSGAGDLPDLVGPSATGGREVVPGAEYYWIVALGLTPLLGIHLWVTVRRWREMEEER
ncbi:vWA domain-containing protein [Nocardioides jishulii]|uniref:VWA domain-containing protein n=1 Tax=Nocardioides jishulii TaxID=2575440 RepID=A0A4U2YIH2_9ACTN|nr:VWA domain-containing protein [Nocardioides jishulii]QCX28232.1 VWA domain-containing protein [Nocardioides jishulii]TKI60896.1 VWA domain-containing protein [Nocardioides jishulii]